MNSQRNIEKLQLYTLLGAAFLLPLLFKGFTFSLEFIQSLGLTNKPALEPLIQPLVLIFCSVAYLFFNGLRQLSKDEQTSFSVLVAGYCYAVYYVCFEYLELGSIRFFLPILVSTTIAKFCLNSYIKDTTKKDKTIVE